MDANIIAAIIAGVVALAVATAGIIANRKKRFGPSIEAFKLGYTLVELSRFARARRLQIADDRPQRQFYEATVVKLNLLRKSLGLDSAIVPSYDEHSDDTLFSHYSILFEGLYKKARRSFEMGKTAGNILLNMLPDYLAFAMQGEDRATEFLATAVDSCDKLSDLWKSLFGNSRSAAIEVIRGKIGVLQSKSDNTSIDTLVKECETIAEKISTEFEERA